MSPRPEKRARHLSQQSYRLTEKMLASVMPGIAVADAAQG